MNKPIYKPKGKAKEYGEWAINIYTGCNHGCVYCYAPKVLRKSREEFSAEVRPRKDIAERVWLQLAKDKDFLNGGQTIHLCFTCDPYPAPPVDTTPTREIIKAIKESGNNVQILTKGGYRGLRDIDLLNENDSYGITVSGNNEQVTQNEPGAASLFERLASLEALDAQNPKVKTWASFEPVYSPQEVYEAIRNAVFIDLFKIGKLNYAPSDINWGEFGRECERLCQKYGRNYYIKEDLRKEMAAMEGERE